MNRQRLAFLLEKQQFGSCTDDERAELETWYRSFDTRERDITLELENEPAEALRIESDLRDRVPGLALGVRKANDLRWVRQQPWVGLAAAMMLLLLGVGAVWWKSSSANKNQYIVWSTLQKHSRKVLLPDSSVVWLKGGTKLKYRKTFGENTRDVFLDGEAFFDVRHDAGKPFVVHTTDLKVKVLGTTFNVKSYSSDQTAEATLVKGKVLVEDNNAPEREPIILSPHQRATYSRGVGTVMVQAVTDQRVIRELDLATLESESMVFDAVPFSELIVKLERRFQIKIHLNNRQVLHCLFTADLKQEGLTEILQLIAASHGVTYRINGYDVYINGNICPN